MNKKIAFIIALLTIGLVSRFMPHYPNFTAIGAVALLGGSLLRKPLEGIILPLVILFVSDLILNNLIYAGESFTVFYQGAAYIYIAVVLSALIGRFVTRLNPKNFLMLSIASSLVFFLISNFGVWKTGLLYPATGQGLIASYIAAIPYGLSHLAGTLTYGVVIMAAYKYMVKEQSTSFTRI